MACYNVYIEVDLLWLSEVNQKKTLKYIFELALNKHKTDEEKNETGKKFCISSEFPLEFPEIF